MLFDPPAFAVEIFFFFFCLRNMRKEVLWEFCACEQMYLWIVGVRVVKVATTLHEELDL